jgi:hypothetical protein
VAARCEAARRERENGNVHPLRDERYALDGVKRFWSERAVLQPRNVRSFRYWANWYVNQKRARCANASSPGRVSEPGAVRPNLGQRKHTGASRPARRFSRLEEQETSAVERA